MVPRALFVRGYRPRVGRASRAALVAGGLALVQMGWAGDGSVELDVHGDDLARVLLQIAREGGIEIVFLPEALHSKRAPALQGRFPPAQAIEMLVAPSGMTVRRTDQGALIIEPGEETDDVTTYEGETHMASDTARPRGVLMSAIAALFAGGTGGSALAQDPADPVGEALEEVVVTGSRIQRTGMTTPVPVTVMTQEEMELLAPGTLMDALDAMPQFLNNTTAQTAGSSSWVSTGGQSTVNMRGLQSQRTLVLLDGRRVVPSNHLGIVDVNLFPQALVRRTEVVTGGASAAYGSDAIAGVTNFIIDSEFTGLEAMLQGGISHQEDVGNVRTSVAGGFPIGERAHVLLSGEYYRAGGIPTNASRDWYKSWGTLNFGASGGVPNQTPQRVRYEDVCTRNNTFGGMITHGPLAGIHFLSDGTPAYWVDGVLDGSATSGRNVSTGANPNGIMQGNQVGGSCDFHTNQGDYHSVMMAGQERASYFGRISYELPNGPELSLQGIYADSRVTGQRGGMSMSGTRDAITIYDDNAFLPEAVRTMMQEAGIESFRMNKVIPQTDPLNISGVGASQNVSKTKLITAGVLGSAFGWNYNAYYQYGLGNRFVAPASYRVDRNYRAIDSVLHPETGQIVCRSTLSVPDDGCIPWNIFGQGNESAQVSSYVNTREFWVNSDVQQHTAEILVDGELHQGWGAGPVFMAAGAGYRTDHLYQVGGDALGSPLPTPPDGQAGWLDLDEDGNRIYRGFPSGLVGNTITAFTNAPTIRGGYDVWEVFTEAIVPLVRARRGAEAVDMNLAARYASYSGSGGVWAWKGGFDWQITDDVRARTTLSRDIRAGNTNERFNRTTGGGTVTDPWRDDDTYTISVHVGGNPEVEPEYSDAWTVGVVYQPSFVTGLATSFDYFDIRISDAISQIGISNIVNECFDRGAFCNQITRGVDDRIQVIRNIFINLDEFRTRGADIELAYRRPVNFFGGTENLSLRALGSRLFESSITPYQADKIERVGLGTFPNWNVTLSASYMRGPVSVSWTERWRSSVKQNLDWVDGVDIDRNRIPSQSVSNLRVSYNLDREGGSYSMYAAVQNLFDHNPGKVQGLSNIYGDVGRAYTVGIRFRN